LSTGDDSSLERRALAAAAAQRDRGAIRDRERERRQAREAKALIARAVREIELRLGHRTSPADWKVVKERFHSSSEPEVRYAVTRLLGVPIRVSSNPLAAPVLPDERPEAGKAAVVLSLASFGNALERIRALEQMRQRLSESKNANDPEGSSH
jgi:hypothetical protein